MPNNVDATGITPEVTMGLSFQTGRHGGIRWVWRPEPSRMVKSCDEYESRDAAVLAFEAWTQGREIRSGVSAD